jgi:hypothetical protein
MKNLRFIHLGLSLGLILGVSGALAAPVESVDSARASAALQQVENFLLEQAVAEQLATLGLDADLVRARLAGLSDAQLEALAAQVELLAAGGTIQGAEQRKGILSCITEPLGRLFYNLYQLIFCWGDLR